MATVLAVPRRGFLPDTLWVPDGQDPRYRPVTWADDPGRWRALAAGEHAVVTQVDHGNPTAPDGTGHVPTSTTEAPGAVVVMLDQLGTLGGERVLEIGTGTGWTAALLAHRLGAERITTVEIDHRMARGARRALCGAGFDAVTVVQGDGFLGVPGDAPFDRVLCTAPCPAVPLAWVQRCPPGGRIVAPWGTPFCRWALLVLDVGEDGTATGSVVGTAHVTRAQWRDTSGVGSGAASWGTESAEAAEIGAPADIFAGARAAAASATVRQTWLTPADVMLHEPVLMTMSARVAQCRAHYRPPSVNSAGESALILWDRQTGSWARLQARPDDDQPHVVLQGGERQLFDEVEAAYHWWIEQGCPAVDQWRVIVDRDGQRIELP